MTDSTPVAGTIKPLPEVLISLGITTAYNDSGLTPYDRLVLMAYDDSGHDWGFDADDAQEVVSIIDRLASDVFTARVTPANATDTAGLEQTVRLQRAMIEDAVRKLDTNSIERAALRAENERLRKDRAGLVQAAKNVGASFRLVMDERDRLQAELARKDALVAACEPLLHMDLWTESAADDEMAIITMGVVKSIRAALSDAQKETGA